MCLQQELGLLEAFPTLGMKHHSHLPPPRGWCGEGAMPSRLARSTAVVKGTHRLLSKDLTARINVFILRSDETSASSLISEYSYTVRSSPLCARLGAGRSHPSCDNARLGVGVGVGGGVLARQPRRT